MKVTSDPRMTKERKVTEAEIIVKEGEEGDERKKASTTYARREESLW